MKKEIEKQKQKFIKEIEMENKKKNFDDIENDHLLSFKKNLMLENYPKVEKSATIEIKGLEHTLHSLMILFNKLKDFDDIYNFNILFDYHKLNVAGEEEKESIKIKINLLKEKFPFISEFYYICTRFLDFLSNLSFENRFLENDSFSYKLNKIQSNKIFLEFKEPSFHFSTFYYISSYYENESFKPSKELREMNLILQYKFFSILNKFFDVYPLPKDPRELEVYYKSINKIGLEDKNKNKNLEKDEKNEKNIIDSPEIHKNIEIISEKIEEKKNDIIEEDANLVPVQSKSWKRKILCCCNSKKDLSNNNKLKILKIFTPLMSLSIDNESNLHLQVINKMLLDFTIAYLNTEETLLNELFTVPIKESLNNSDENKNIKNIEKGKDNINLN